MKPRSVTLAAMIALLYPPLCVAEQSVAYAPDNAAWRSGLLKYEAPAYPYLAKLYGCRGEALFRVTINPATGAPGQIVMLKSSGFGILDNSAAAALRAWRWKRGTRKQFDIPIAFGLSNDYPKNPMGTSLLPRSPR